MTQEILTSKEAALYMGIEYRTLTDSRLAERLMGRPPPSHHKKGRFIFYRKKDLDDWLGCKEPMSLEWAQNFLWGNDNDY